MRDNTIYWDEECKIAMTKIYQNQDDDSRSLYLDENLQNQLIVRELPANQSAATSSSRSGDIVSKTSTSPPIRELPANQSASSSRSGDIVSKISTSPPIKELPANQSAATSSSRSGDIVSKTSTSSPVHEAFSRDEILYLIDKMRQYATKDEELPRSIQELESRISRGRGQKKQMWREIATDMTNTFKLDFDPGKVSRKWQTHVDGYKRAEDNNKLTGKGPSKFQYMTEMSDLIGDRHDIHIPVTGSAKGVIIHRSEELDQKKSDQEVPGASRPMHSPPVKKRKGAETSAVLAYLKETEAAAEIAAAERQKLLMQHMERSEQAFLTVFERCFNKLAVDK